MKTTYKISEDDFINVLNWIAEVKLAWRTRLARTMRPLLWALIWVMSALILIMLALTWAGVAQFGRLILTSVIGELWIGLATWINSLPNIYFATELARWTYRRTKAIRAEFSIELLNGGIRLGTPTAETILVWERIWKWQQNENYILIYSSPRMFQILPKSIAASGFDVPLLIQQLTEYVGKFK
jgi:hypothetical protein